MRGQFIDEVNPDKAYAAYLESMLNCAAEEKRPILSSSEAHDGRKDAYQKTLRVTCPLSSDGGTADMFLTTQIFRRQGFQAPSIINAPMHETSDFIVL